MTPPADKAGTTNLRSIAKQLARLRAEVLGLAGLVVGVLVTVNALLGLILLGFALAVYGVAEWGHRLLGRGRRARIDDTMGHLNRMAQVQGRLSALALDAQLVPPWRISIYEFTDGYWRRVARDSNYAPFRNCGRHTLPAGEGVLAWAARTGGFNDLVGLPDPMLDWQGYLNFHASRNVPCGTVTKFTMRSRAYAGVVTRLNEGGDKDLDVGLIVESEDPDGINAGLVQRHVSRNMVTLLHRLAVVGVRLAEAEEALRTGDWAE